MGINLGPLNIKDTYEQLVQISGSQLTDGTGSLISNLTVTASFASQAGTAGYAAQAGTSGLAVTASFANQAGTSGLAVTASFANQAGTSGFAVTASYAENAAGVPLALFTASISDATITFTKGDASTFPIEVNNVSSSISASYAAQAGTAGFASQAGTAGFASTAGNGFPYTGSALITGSLGVTGSIAVQSGSYDGFVIDNLTTPTASDAIAHVVALSAAEYDAILSPDPNTYYIISDATGSVILGDTVVSGSLTVTGTLSAPGLIVASASFADQAGTAGFAAQAGTSGFAVTASYAENATPTFPYSGSAVITGSLIVSGSANIGYPESNTVTGEIASVIAAISASATGQYAFVGGGLSHNVTGVYGAAVGGNNATVSGFRAAQLGGEFNDINGTTATGVGGFGNNVGGSYTVNVGGTSNTIGGTTGGAFSAASAQGTGFVYAIIGGANHNVQTDSTVVAAGNRNTTISGHRDGGIFGGNDHIINGNDTDRSVIIGGSTNLIQSSSFGDSVIVGGKNNKVYHSASVVLGGDGLETTKNEEVVVPRLTISGSFVDTVVIANWASIDFVDDAAAAAGGIPLGGVYRNGNFLMIRIV